MFEFAASEFDSLMIGRGFRSTSSSQVIQGGSVVLGIDRNTYTDFTGNTLVTFTSSADTMDLKVQRRDGPGSPHKIIISESYTDFGAVREAIADVLS